MNNESRVYVVTTVMIIIIYGAVTILISIRLSLIWAMVRFGRPALSVDLTLMMLVHSIESIVLEIVYPWHFLVRAFKNVEAELFYIAIFVSIVTVSS